MYKDIKFKSIGELVDYIFDDGVLYRKSTSQYIKLNNGMIEWNDGGEFNLNNKLQLDWMIKCEWYEDIPEGGVLCWSNEWSLDYKWLVLISSYNSQAVNKFYSSVSGTGFKNATPLTSEEIDELKKNVPK